MENSSIRRDWVRFTGTAHSRFQQARSVVPLGILITITSRTLATE